MKNWLLRLVMAVTLVVGQLAPANAQMSDVVKNGEIDLLNEAVTLVNIGGRPGVACVIGGTFSATLTPEISVNDSVWETTQFYDISAKARVATTAASGSYVILGTAGMTAARVKATAYTSGTVTVTIRAGAGPLSLPADVMSSAPAGTENGLVVRSIAGTGTSATEVQGTAASGSAAVGDPVQIGGIQTNGNMQTVKVGPDGYIWANLGASSSVIGAVTQSGTWTATAPSTGSIGSASAFPMGAVNPAGAVVIPKAGTDSSLFVTLQASTSVVGAVTQSGTWVATAPSTGSIGTASAFPFGAVDPAGSVVIPKVGTDGSQFVTLQASSSVIGAVTQSGTWTSTAPATGSIGSASAFPMGAVNPAGAVVIPKAGSDSSLLVTLQASSSVIGAVTQSGTWTATAPSTGSIGTASAFPAGAVSPSGTVIIPKAGVDGSLFVTLQASTSAIGKLSANSGVDIGDVDVLSIAAGNNNIGDVDIASAPTGASSIQVQGAQLDGAATASSPVLVSGADSTGRSQTIATDLDGSVFVVLQASTSVIGKLAANSGVDIGDTDILSIAAGDNNIGNMDVVTMPTGATSAQVQGTVADGSAAAQNPVQAAGKDGAGNIQTILTDTTGAIQVDIESGTVTANAGTGTFTTGGVAADGAAVSGNPVRIGGKDGSGNTQDILTDTGGAIQVDVESGSITVSSGTITAVGGAADGAAVSGNPVRAAGKDSAGNTQDLVTGLDGSLYVTLQASTSAIGTVAQGASISSGIPWSVIRKSSDGAAESDNWVTPVDAAAKSITGNSAVQLYTTGAPKIAGLWIQPTDGTIYLGGASVTPSTGLPLVSGQTFTLTCTPCSGHYATSSATVNTVVVPVLSN